MPQTPHDSTRSYPTSATTHATRSDQARKISHLANPVVSEVLESDALGSLARACEDSKRVSYLIAVLISFVVTGVGSTNVAHAQDWGDSEDDWSTEASPAPASYESAGWNETANTGWSFRVGAGFTIDPNTFLMNFELPYQFDRFVSVGPMVQVGVEDDRLIVAPTANLSIRIPDMPGNDFDRFHPSISAGLGMAILENDDRGGENTDVGFLVNTGVGIEFDLSERVTLGSRMLFNFMPVDRTLGEKFWYSWEVGSVRLAF